jgi:hypothetical protein
MQASCFEEQYSPSSILRHERFVVKAKCRTLTLSVHGPTARPPFRWLAAVTSSTATKRGYPPARNRPFLRTESLSYRLFSVWLRLSLGLQFSNLQGETCSYRGVGILFNVLLIGGDRRFIITDDGITACLSENGGLS